MSRGIEMVRVSSLQHHKKSSRQPHLQAVTYPRLPLLILCIAFAHNSESNSLRLVWRKPTSLGTRNSAGSFKYFCCWRFSTPNWLHKIVKNSSESPTSSVNIKRALGPIEMNRVIAWMLMMQKSFKIESHTFQTMTFSGLCGTLVGFATCGLLIYKIDSDSMKAAWTILLTSVAAGWTTTYCLHELMQKVLSQPVFEMLEDNYGTNSLSFTLNTNFSLPPEHFSNEMRESQIAVQENRKISRQNEIINFYNERVKMNK